MTGLIYVAIVALWAAVLIPMWLRRHDDGEAHRLERHQEAMGILARFRTGGTAGWTPARRAARRRRMILATLLAVTVTGVAAWVLQVAGLWVIIVPGLALLAFVASAAWATRSQANRTVARPSAMSRARRSASVRQDEGLVEEFDEEFVEEFDEAMATETAYEQEWDRESERAQARIAQREERRAQRRDRVAAAERAEQDRYSDVESRTRRTIHSREVIVTPPARTPRDRVALEGTAIDQVDAHDDSTRASTVGRRRPAWDQVFDQTA